MKKAYTNAESSEIEKIELPQFEAVQTRKSSNPVKNSWTDEQSQENLELETRNGPTSPLRSRPERGISRRRTSVVEENLGDNFYETAWVPPSIQKVMLFFF